MEKIKENNEIIRNFIGTEFTAATSPDITFTNGLYHKNWDSLMDVIKKIDRVCELHPKAVEYLSAKVGAINYLFGDVVVASNLKEVYVEIVEFIQLYNNNEFTN